MTTGGMGYYDLPLHRRIHPDSIPLELRLRPQWVVWKAVPVGNKIRKVPHDPIGYARPARTNDPGTWGHFDTVYRRFLSGTDMDGIGYVFQESDPYCGIDLDCCLGMDGELLGWACEPLRALQTYRELSPSGSGIKAIGRATLAPGGLHKRGGFGPDGNGAIEVYDRLRYFTITGDILDTFHDRPRKIQAEVDAILDSLAPPPVPLPQPVVIPSGSLRLYDPDHAGSLLDKARASATGMKFSALYDDSSSCGYPSRSEADGALLMFLAFWTGNDPTLMEALFSLSARGLRAKWRENHYDYRRRSIESACAKVRNVYRSGS